MALALVTGACDAVSRPTTPTALRTGYDTFDGSLRVWPPRGGLAGDRSLAGQVTAAVDRWRTPTGDRVHLPSSGILWLGEVDGTRLALVAANVPGGKASWLLQLSGQKTAFQVDRAAEYTDPGYLVYSDVLPVHLPAGRRYLVSTRVQRLVGPTGAEVAIDDGLSARVAVPACTAVAVTATLRPTESLPDGNPEDRLVDLGTGIADPRYPLVRDEPNTAMAALDGLDTCALADRDAAFGSIPRRDPAGDVIDGVPVSWPLDRITARELGEFRVGQRPPARFTQLRWRADAGTMSAVVHRGPGGPATVSHAERSGPLQVYVLPMGGRSYVVVLVWRPDPETALSTPAGLPRLVDEPGLVVLPAPTGEQEQAYSLQTAWETYERSLSARDLESASD